MDFFRFSMDFFGFLCAGGGCRTPPHFLGLGTPVRSWACQRRPSQSFTKAWRKRTSRMPGDFCVYGFCWNSLWLHQIINDSVWIIWIFIYLYWLPADFLQFPMMSCVFHIISSYPMDFLYFFWISVQVPWMSLYLSRFLFTLYWFSWTPNQLLRVGCISVGWVLQSFQITQNVHPFWLGKYNPFMCWCLFCIGFCRDRTST